MKSAEMQAMPSALTIHGVAALEVSMPTDEAAITTLIAGSREGPVPDPETRPLLVGLAWLITLAVLAVIVSNRGVRTVRRRASSTTGPGAS